MSSSMVHASVAAYVQIDAWRVDVVRLLFRAFVSLFLLCVCVCLRLIVCLFRLSVVCLS